MPLYVSRFISTIFLITFSLDSRLFSIVQTIINLLNCFNNNFYSDRENGFAKIIKKKTGYY